MLFDATTPYADVFKTELLPALSRLDGRARRLTGGDVSAAEDLLQETALRAWRFADRYRPNSNPEAWLVTIMRNLWLNKLAKRRRAPEISESQLCQLRYHQDHRGDFAEHKYVVDRNVLSLSSDGSLAMSDAATTAEECLDGQLDKQRAAAAIDAALAKMPSSHARAWSAFEREHLSYAEIAEREDVLVGTVMSRIYRARRAIESAFAAA